MDSPCGGVILCGGRSRRMGRPKWSLPFGNETLLERVLRTVGTVVAPVVIVAASEQELPPLPAGSWVVRDETPDLGALAALAAGLSSLADHGIEAAFVSACDTPLLTPEFVRSIVDALGNHEIALPWQGDFYHPLAGVYRTSLAARIGALIATGQRRPLSLLTASDTLGIEPLALRRVDPELDSLRNANTSDEYQRLLLRAGLANGADDEA